MKQNVISNNPKGIPNISQGFQEFQGEFKNPIGVSEDFKGISENFEEFLNNSKNIPSIFREFQLRFLITEKKERIISSWCSDEFQGSRVVQSKPVLQYSFDSKHWFSVPVVIEREE